MMHTVAAFPLRSSVAATQLLCKGCLKNLRQTPSRTLFNIFQKWKKAEEPKLPTNYSLVKPGKVSPMKSVPDGIETPSYAFCGLPPKAPQREIFVLDAESIGAMREAGKLARTLLDYTASHIEVGVTTDHLDEVIHQACIDHTAYPSTLNYNCFPKSVCTSVNNVMVHGIPDDRPLEDGDIITVDFTVYLDGFHADLSETYLVGDVDEAGRHLVEQAKRCRDEAIKACGPDRLISVIGNTISSIARAEGLHVCPSFIGHGINKFFHCKPDVWHYANAYPERMPAGLTFTIEPVLLERMDRAITGPDNWTVFAEHHTRSAQFEHTVLITNTGVEVLTAGEGEDFTMATNPATQEDEESGTLSQDDWEFEKKS